MNEYKEQQSYKEIIHSEAFGCLKEFAIWLVPQVNKTSST